MGVGRKIGVCCTVFVALLAVFFGVLASSHPARQRFFAGLWGMMAEEVNHDLLPYKEEFFKALQNLPVGARVVELGPGTGANFRFLPKHIHWEGAEPNPHLLPLLNESIAASGFPAESVKVLAGKTSEEHLASLQDGSVDAVLSTLVLCTVPDPAAVLKEIVRVLRPGASFYFLEHVAFDRETLNRSFQELVTPLWNLIGDGCYPNRETWQLVEEAGFGGGVQYMNFTVGGPMYFFVGPHIAGTATK
ncbi:Methyltransferase like 7A [Balamuthia mandrillaris]